MTNRAQKYNLTDSYNEELASYINFKKNNNEFKSKIENEFYSNSLPISETWNSYRIINHWMNKWLIDDNRENKNSWRKFNFKELLWISIITKLRNFDFPINKILKVKKWILHNEELFDLYLTSAYFKFDETKLLVFNDWDVILTWQLNLESRRTSIIIDDYISISLSEILEVSLNNHEGNNSGMLLNNIEKSFFRDMSKKRNMEYTVKTNNGQIRKYKVINKECHKLENIKDLNLRELVKSNKNSSICIYTNSDWSITDIELSKTSD